MASDSGGSGGMSVSLASSDGCVVGGEVAGLLIAASPVQIVVGSYLRGNQHNEQKPKKHKTDFISSSVILTMVTVPISSPDMEEPYGTQKNISSSF